MKIKKYTLVFQTLIVTCAPVLVISGSCIGKPTTVGPGRNFMNDVAHINITKNSESFDDSLGDFLYKDWRKYGRVTNEHATSPSAFFHNHWSYTDAKDGHTDFHNIRHENKYHPIPIKFMLSNLDELHYDSGLYFWGDGRRSGSNFNNTQASLTDDGLNFIYNEILNGTVQNAEEIYNATKINKDDYIFTDSYMDSLLANLTNENGQHGVPYGSETLGFSINQKALEYFDSLSPNGEFDELLFGMEKYGSIRSQIGDKFENLIDYILINGWSYNQMIKLAEGISHINNFSAYPFYSNDYNTLHAISSKRFFNGSQIFNGIVDRGLNVVEEMITNNSISKAELKLLIEKNIEPFFGERYKGEILDNTPEFVFTTSEIDINDEDVKVANTKKLPLPLYIEDGDKLFNDIVVMPKKNMFWFTDRDQEIKREAIESQTSMFLTLATPTLGDTEILPKYLSPYASPEYIEAFREESKDREQLTSILVGNSNNFSFSMPGDVAIWYENIRSQYIIDWINGDSIGISDIVFNKSSNILDTLINEVNS